MESITLNNLKADLESWDNFKVYLEALPPHQAVGISAHSERHPIAIFLRLKYQTSKILVDPLLSRIEDCEILTPHWARRSEGVFSTQAGTGSLQC